MIMPKPLNLLVVFAHPDDESMGMGGALAKYSAQGVEAQYICASCGERGWFDPQHADAATAVLAMQETFYRVFSLMNAGKRIESDLLEGLRL